MKKTRIAKIILVCSVFSLLSGCGFSKTSDGGFTAYFLTVTGPNK